MSKRLRSIVESMNIRPGDDVLEIGCGQGVAATIICEQLTTGHYVAIDRSKKMIDAAVRRNQRHIESGKAEFHIAEVLGFHPGPQRFDKILAVRVGLLHRDTGAARRHIEAWLKRHGKMFLIYDEP